MHCAFSLLPAHEARHPQASCVSQALLLQLRSASQVSENADHRLEVCQGADCLVGVGGGSDLDRALEILEPAPVAQLHLAAADRVQVASPDRLEAEALRKLQGLIGKAEGLLVVGHHQDPSKLLEHEGFRGRRLAVGEQLLCKLEVLQRLVTFATVDPHAGEPGSRLGRILDLARGQEPLARLGQDPIVEIGVVHPAARVGQQQLGPLRIVRRPELERRLVEAARRRD